MEDFGHFSVIFSRLNQTPNTYQYFLLFVPRTDYGDIFLYSVPVLYVITTIQRIREMKTIDDYIL